jgi:CRISPR-associated protein Cas1
VEVAWLAPQSEYRPTEYLQAWVRFWFDDELRLEAAKTFQLARLERIAQYWCNNRQFTDQGFKLSQDQLLSALAKSKQMLVMAVDGTALLTEEARLTKKLFKLAADAVGYGEFLRAKNGSSSDPANRFLDHGNYLAYGLAASATWVLGLPHGLAILHGKTRRGGLVFDVADLVKDAIILPQAFISSMRGDDEQTFRQSCIENFSRTESLDFMIDTLKAVALKLGASSR